MSYKAKIETVWKGDEVKVAARQVTGKTAYEIGLIVEGQAKLLAPRDTGYLAASITTQAFDKGTDPETPNKYGSGKNVHNYSDSNMVIQSPADSNEVLVGTPLFYAPYVEFGTIKTVAQPFLRPALDMAKGKVMNLIEMFGKRYFANYMTGRDVFLASRKK